MIDKRFKFIAIGISIIGVIIIGFYLGALFFRTTYVVEEHDSVKLEYTVWVSDESEAYDPLNPVFDAILVIRMIPISEDSEDGLILGLYNNLLGKKVGFESGLFWLNKCIDQNRDGIDDFTGQPRKIRKKEINS